MNRPNGKTDEIKMAACAWRLWHLLFPTLRLRQAVEFAEVRPILHAGVVLDVSCGGRAIDQIDGQASRFWRGSDVGTRIHRVGMRAVGPNGDAGLGDRTGQGAGCGD